MARRAVSSGDTQAGLCEEMEEGMGLGRARRCSGGAGMCAYCAAHGCRQLREASKGQHGIL